ncbi:hypothetical protein ADL22_13785 [Streptomyces sp. NRRL F-4489]|uniref:hypothetical protein n=1 Tax=Streptomyces sp. NRRL F-4489 TaxID=1609095 RepID=UPI00074A74F2|nr:hypothetical protein [Streptomyces sp. NRRL F-4489]KUL43038.1 hypothetical protein ADL22_13785 [Streptomyces sp. NRRL F-4489]
MRKIMSIALAGVVCGASLTLATAADAAAAGQVPRCVKVQKYFSQGGQRYVRLTNLCAQRPACYTIVIPHAADPRGRLPKGATKDVRYGTTAGSRALYVKNVAC